MFLTRLEWHGMMLNVHMALAGSRGWEGLPVVKVVAVQKLGNLLLVRFSAHPPSIYYTYPRLCVAQRFGS